MKLERIWKNKVNIENYRMFFLKWFLIIQPIFEIKLFYNSISTLIRVIIIYIYFGYYFLKDKSKNKKYIIVYVSLLVFYFILHNFNSMNFKSLVPGDFGYSVIKEALYFIKMLVPFLLIYVIKESRLNKNDLLIIIKAWALIIGLIIIISNIFCISYGTYSDEKILNNFFSWFSNNNKYNYKNLCSKGLFEYGNQISAILIITLAVNYNSLLSEDKYYNFIMTLVNMLSLFLIGTKVAVFGAIIVCIYVLFIYIILNRKFIIKKNIIIAIVCLIIYCIILPFNPTFSRIEENKEVIESNLENNIEFVTIIEKDYEEVNDIILNKQETIEESYKDMNINENFIKNRYPYKYDIDFWYEIIINNTIPKSEYRFLEKAMVKRVVEINNNKMDKWLGITNTRLQNIFNIEQDFIVQYYALGIIGSLLVLGPYIILIVFLSIQTLKNKEYWKSLVWIITIVFILAIAYYSGNLFNSLSFTIYYTSLFSLIQKNIMNKNI